LFLACYPVGSRYIYIVKIHTSIHPPGTGGKQE
jgi:hypothetical protein